MHKSYDFLKYEDIGCLTDVIQMYKQAGTPKTILYHIFNSHDERLCLKFLLEERPFVILILSSCG